jgi:Na+/proline symporter
VAVISKTYQVGLAGIWYQWLWLFCTPFYWILAPLFRRMRCITTADYFEKRYSSSVATLFTVSALCILVADMGTMLLGSGKVIEALTLGKVNYTAAVFGVTVMFLIYGLAGGLIAAVVTDFIQGIFTVVLSFILVPFALYKVGGFSGLHQRLDENLFSLVVPGEISLFFITMVVINGLFNIVVQPHIMSNTGAGKTEFEGRFGFTAGNFLKRFCTIAWAFTGLACIALYPGLTDSDHAFGTAARDLLPIGLAGILMASLIASVQSTCDALMVTAAGLYTRNIHRRFIRPRASERGGPCLCFYADQRDPRARTLLEGVGPHGHRLLVRDPVAPRQCGFRVDEFHRRGRHVPLVPVQDHRRNAPLGNALLSEHRHPLRPCRRVCFSPHGQKETRRFLPDPAHARGPGKEAA